MGLQQIHPQCRPAHLRLYLRCAEVARPAQVEPALHRAEGLLNLEADGADLLVELLE